MDDQLVKVAIINRINAFVIILFYVGHSFSQESWAIDSLVVFMGSHSPKKSWILHVKPQCEKHYLQTHKRMHLLDFGFFNGKYTDMYVSLGNNDCALQPFY